MSRSWILARVDVLVVVVARDESWSVHVCVSHCGGEVGLLVVDNIEE